MDRRDTSGQIFPSLPRNNKARSLNHIPKLLLPRKFLYALHQILVAVPISRNKLSNQRDSPKTPPLIHSVKERVPHTRELQTGKDASGLQHPVRFPQCFVFVCEIADSERDSVEINRVVRDSEEVLGIGDEKFETRGVGVGGGQGALLALFEHGWVDVRDGYGAVGRGVYVRGMVEEPEGDVAGSAGYVEHLPAWGRGAGVGG